MTLAQKIAARYLRKRSYLAPHPVSYFIRKIPTYIQQKWKIRAKANLDVAKDALSAVADISLPDGSFIEIDMTFSKDLSAEYVENLEVMAYPKGGRGIQVMRQKKMPFSKLVPSDILDGAMQELEEAKK
jgi:hypothetical protein